MPAPQPESDLSWARRGRRRVHGIFASFHPRAHPLMTRLSYRRELASWVYLPLMLSGLQGGTIAIFVKKTFEGSVSEEQLNFAVGLVAASKAIGHLASFLWASLSHGRPKIQYIVRLQLFTALFIGSIAFGATIVVGIVDGGRALHCLLDHLEWCRHVASECLASELSSCPATTHRWEVGHRPKRF